MGLKKVVYGCDPKKDKNCKCKSRHTNGHKNGVPYRKDELICEKIVN